MRAESKESRGRAQKLDYVGQWVPANTTSYFTDLYTKKGNLQSALGGKHFWRVSGCLANRSCELLGKRATLGRNRW